MANSPVKSIGIAVPECSSEEVEATVVLEDPMPTMAPPATAAAPPRNITVVPVASRAWAHPAKKIAPPASRTLCHCLCMMARPSKARTTRNSGILVGRVSDPAHPV
jgi:hypothetical protein